MFLFFLTRCETRGSNERDCRRLEEEKNHHVQLINYIFLLANFWDRVFDMLVVCVNMMMERVLLSLLLCPLPPRTCLSFAYIRFSTLS